MSRLSADRFWHAPVAATFHGRDILAPVAAHWSLGTELAEFGPSINPDQLVKLSSREPHWEGATLVGQIESIDTFGNLITNIRESYLASKVRAALTITVGGHRIQGLSHSYCSQPPGALIALIGSSGRLEIALNAGSALQNLDVPSGTQVRVSC